MATDDLAHEAVFSSCPGAFQLQFPVSQQHPNGCGVISMTTWMLMLGSKNVTVGGGMRVKPRLTYENRSVL